MKKSFSFLGLLFVAQLCIANPMPSQMNTYPCSRIGILWSTWHPDHFMHYEDYVATMEQWGMSYVSINPTYFLNTYAEGILTEWNGQEVTPSIALQKSVVKHLIAEGFYINYRPHVDPIKFAMQEGSSERNNCNTNPGGKDWRGEFDLMDPTDPTIGYKEKVILPGLQMLAEAIRESKKAGYTLVSPIRFDLGAELMDAMLNYPTHWSDLLAAVRTLLNTTYSDVKNDIVLGHNFCHHIEYLMRLPGHPDFFRRIMADQTTVGHDDLLYLDRPGITDATRKAIGQYIAGLDEMSLSQYMPLDIFTPADEKTTADEVYTALLWHEQNFINECLVQECGVPIDKLPILHIGEYGMGWRGLNAPNVWDVQAWQKAGNGAMILSESEQKQDAAIAIDGIIKYVDETSPTNYRSFLLWFGGKPYDLLNINSYSNWYNPKAATALQNYWATHKGMPSLDPATDADFGVEDPDLDAVPPVRTKKLLDDFEDYTNNAELQQTWQRNGNGASIVPAIDTEHATEGMQCMQLTYDLTGNTYAGVMKSGSGSVAGFDGIAYTLIPDNSGADLLIQIQDGSGHYWKSTIQLTGTQPQDIFLPFDAFVGGYNTSGTWNNPADITEVAFYVEKGTKGTIYIDNLRATYTQEKIDSLENLTSVAEVETLSMNMFPNPAHTYVRIACEKPIRHLALYDACGRSVMALDNYTQQEVVLPTAGLCSSIYVCRVVTEDEQVYVRRLVVKH